MGTGPTGMDMKVPPAIKAAKSAIKQIFNRDFLELMFISLIRYSAVP